MLVLGRVAVLNERGTPVLCLECLLSASMVVTVRNHGVLHKSAKIKRYTILPSVSDTPPGVFSTLPGVSNTRSRLTRCSQMTFMEYFTDVRTSNVCLAPSLVYSAH